MPNRLARWTAATIYKRPLWIFQKMSFLRTFISHAPFLLALVAASARGAQGRPKCPDGSEGLTRALYEAGDRAQYANVTCIPPQAFKDYGGDVTLEGRFPFLKSIEKEAFWYMIGTLSVKGGFPLLSSIELRAFEGVRSSNSAVDLSGGLPELATIEESAFSSFRGTVNFQGKFPLLSNIGKEAFYNVLGASSTLELLAECAPKLATIGRGAFQRNQGKINVRGSFPLLAFIGSCAFYDTGKAADSTIEFLGLPTLAAVERTTFSSFHGLLTFKGSYPLLSDIGTRAFYLGINGVKNANSSIELLGESVPKLASIGEEAFLMFTGSIKLSGSFSVLTSIGSQAFYCPAPSVNPRCSANSSVALVGARMPRLVTIGRNAFTNFRGSLSVKGIFPLLSSIGQSAFYDVLDPNAKVELADGLPKLTQIGSSAFNSFDGTVVIRGSFPLLHTVGQHAFSSILTSHSAVEFVGGPQLTTIGDSAFGAFRGKVALRGSYPLLSAVGQRAFIRCSHADSTIELAGQLLPALQTIGAEAFEDFGGTMLVSGRFPSLATIGHQAFYGAGNTNSKIEIVEGMPKLSGFLGGDVFHSFKGKLTIIISLSSPFPHLNGMLSDNFRSAGNANSRIELDGAGLPQFGRFYDYSFRGYKHALIIHGVFPLLTAIGDSAFQGAGNGPDSKVELAGLPMLTDIEERAFQSFYGKLSISGAFHRLESIEKLAFSNPRNSAFNIAIGCRSPSGLNIHSDAFDGFNVNGLGNGVRDAAGESVGCGSCPDGTSNALTRTLYEAGDPTKYANATCILDKAFNYYNGNVTLDGGLAHLVSIGERAFAFLKGTLTFSGSFPQLAYIGKNAFDRVGHPSTSNSKVELVASAVPMLTTIERHAFHGFRGVVTLTGGFLHLAKVGGSSFESTYNTQSHVELIDLPKLSTIGEDAFENFGGLLTVRGNFPLLTRIESGAFYHPRDYKGNANSNIEFVGRLVPRLTAIEYMAFDGYEGKLTFTGSFPLLSKIGRFGFRTGSRVHVDSLVELVGEQPKLSVIDENAFQYYRGTITISGRFPSLVVIGRNAFYGAQNKRDKANNITIACRSPIGLSISAGAFAGFKGTHDATGEGVACRAVRFRKLQTLVDRHTDGLRSLAWSHDSTMLATGSADDTVSITNTTSWEVVTTLTGHVDGGAHQNVNAVAWSHDSALLASGYEGGAVMIWDTTTWNTVSTLPFVRPAVYSVAWSHDSQMLAVGNYYSVVIWNATSWERIKTFENTYVYRVAWSHDSTMLATLKAGMYSVVILDTKTWQTIVTLPYQGDNQMGSVAHFAFSHNSALLAVATRGSPYSVPVQVPAAISIFDTQAWKESGTVEQPIATLTKSTADPGRLNSKLFKVAWSPDSLMLAASYDDNLAMIWDANTWNSIAALTDHASLSSVKEVFALEWSPDSKMLATGSRDKTAIIYAVDIDKSAYVALTTTAPTTTIATINSTSTTAVATTAATSTSTPTKTA